MAIHEIRDRSAVTTADKSDLATHLESFDRHVEAFDEAGENWAAEILKYPATDFPPEAIAQFQQSADVQNAQRRQSVRLLRKVMAIALKVIADGRHEKRTGELLERATLAVESANSDREPSFPKPATPSLWQRLFG